jgi:type IV secretory pathway VirB10-like protein
MRRGVTTLVTILLLALAAPALAQDPANPSSPFGPLPPPAPVETPTPEPPPSIEAQKETDRTLMFAIGGGLLVLFVVIGRVITRDARRALHERGRDEKPQPRDQGPHKHARQTKAKARAKTKAQRRARRQNR